MSERAGFQSSSDRLAFCETLAPEIAQLTQAFYEPEAAHPYLKTPSSGGVLTRDVATRQFESLAQVKVSGLPLRSLYTPELFAERGLPVEVSPEGVLWSVATDHYMYPMRLRSEDAPRSAGNSGHTLNYWDGKKWHSSRKATDEQVADQQPEWATATLMSEELMAMRALAKQTRGLHQIAEIYQGDMEQLERDMSQVEVDPETRKWLNIAFASALTMAREVEAAGIGLRGYMTYYGTGYQHLSHLLEYVPLGKPDDHNAVRFGTSVGAALAKMYGGSAFIKRDSMRKRSWRARKAGRPLPLPVAW